MSMSHVHAASPRCMSCPAFRVLPVHLLPFPFCLSCSGCSFQAVLSFSGCQILSGQSCPVLPVLLFQSCSAYPIQPVLFCLSVLFCLFCSACLVLPVQFWLSYTSCHVLPVLLGLPGSSVLLCLSYSVCPSCSARHVPGSSVKAVLFCLSRSCCPVLGVLSHEHEIVSAKIKKRKCTCAKNRGARKIEEREKSGSAKARNLGPKKEHHPGARKRTA